MTADQIVGPLATVIAATITGSAVLVGACLAWRAVQERINAEQRAARETFNLAITAELLIYALPVIKAVSAWNARAHSTPTSIPLSNPTLPRPNAYLALLSDIGLMEGWIASTIIAFYGNVQDLNEMSAEAMQGRATLDITNRTLAERFQAIAQNLALALDGLTSNRAIPIPTELRDFTRLVMPSGATVASIRTPETLQRLLRMLGGNNA